MIQTTEDVYNLILDKRYSMHYDPYAPHFGKIVLTDGTAWNRIEAQTSASTIEIYVFQNGNTQYYEHISKRTNPKNYKHICDALFAKRLVAMVADIEENYR